MEKKLKSIIFIDDDEIIGLVTKRLLDYMQVAEEVLIFSDSLKALQFIKEKYETGPAGPQPNDAPDLILLDIDMPGYGGFEILSFLEELKKSGQIYLDNTSFAIVTSYKTEKEVRLARQHEILTVLEKPLKQKDIQELISKITHPFQYSVSTTH